MLLIFDCDGVLVDSEVLAAKVFSASLENFGINLSPEDCYKQFKGHSLDYCLYSLNKRYTQVNEHFFRYLQRETEKAFEKDLKPVEGVQSVLSYLKEKDIRFCVASNGEHKKITHSLTVTGLLSYFPCNRFSRDDVAEGKPAPDLFLCAAEVNEIEPSQCCVIEDSVTGVRAAQAAGMQVWYFNPGETLASEAVKADLHFSSMSQILGHIRKL